MKMPKDDNGLEKVFYCSVNPSQHTEAYFYLHSFCFAHTPKLIKHLAFILIIEKS